jgi:hypothetical protein
VKDPSHVTKEFALDQFFGDGGTIKNNNGLRLSKTILMDRSCDDILSSSGFSFDDDGCIGRRNLFQNAKDLTHFSGTANQQSKFFAARRFDRNLFIKRNKFDADRSYTNDISWCEVGLFNADVVDESAVGTF